MSGWLIPAQGAYRPTRATTSICLSFFDSTMTRIKFSRSKQFLGPVRLRVVVREQVEAALYARLCDPHHVITLLQIVTLRRLGPPGPKIRLTAPLRAVEIVK